MPQRPITERIAGTGLRRVLGNMGWLFFDKVVRLGLGLVVGVWVARYLGPSLFGGLNFAVAFVGLFGTVATLGMDSIVIREILDAPEHTYRILGTAFTLRVAASVAVAAICIATLFAIRPHDNQAQLLVAILALTLLFQSVDAIDLYFQSQVRSRVTVVAKNSAFILFAGVRVWLIRAHAPVWTFAASAAGEAALGAIGLLIAYGRLQGVRTGLLQWSAHRTWATRMLQQSWPLLGSGLAVIIYMRIDVVMLKMLAGDYVVGVYSAATRISEVWYFIPSVVISSIAPAVNRAKHDTKLLNERMQTLFFGMAWLALVIGSAVALLSPFIIRLLYADSYRDAAPILAVSVWASIFVFLGTAQTVWDVATNLTRLMLYRTVSGAVANILLNLYLIPRYGGMGAAIATVISYALSSVFANAFSAKTRPIFYMQMRSLIPPRRLWK